MSMMKPDQERVKTLLTDTVTLLCKNGLQYSKELKVQGLLGITLDNDDVFVVHIDEIFNGMFGAQITGMTSGESPTSAVAAADSATSDLNLRHKKSTSKISHLSSSGNLKKKGVSHSKSKNEMSIQVKVESGDDDLLVMDSENLDAVDFPEDVQSDGDREAMRKSYGRILTHSEGPPVKRRIPDSISEGLVSNTSNLSNLVEQGAEETSLDCGQLSGICELPADIESAYKDAPGCSGWDSGSKPHAEKETKESQVSVTVLPEVLDGQRMRLPTLYPTVPGTFDPNMDIMDMSDLDLAQPSRRPRYSFKPFECPEPGCGRKFHHRGDVYRHQRINHGAGHIGKPHTVKTKRSKSNYYSLDH